MACFLFVFVPECDTQRAAMQHHSRYQSEPTRHCTRCQAQCPGPVPRQHKAHTMHTLTPRPPTPPKPSFEAVTANKIFFIRFRPHPLFSGNAVASSAVISASGTDLRGTARVSQHFWC